jgi:hypothetical protein
MAQAGDWCAVSLTFSAFLFLSSTLPHTNHQRLSTQKLTTYTQIYIYIYIYINKYKSQAFAERNGITTANLYSWNSVLGADGSGCANSFWANYYYCTGVSG